MTQHDPDLDPVRETVVTRGPVIETVETVVVRESNTGWWIAGILGGLVLIAVLWILFSRAPTPATEDALLEAQADAVAAQAQADRAAVAGQVAGAQASVDIARADAARAAAEARTAEAQAAEPVVIERTVPAPTVPTAPAVVSPTAPQN
ncbi:hypothetical protein [Brevundimonas sp.]|uniref:hypothetical protein n=1 Tax=Brevundimonas sp. TaxID=1871086 RepID=UPI0025BB00D9|nr:hypothetical protein [Brevundimonas sp.]